MKQSSLLTGLLILSLALSIPSLTRIPRVLPFLHVDVREAAPAMLEDLRSRGIWVMNTDVNEIRRGQNAICFSWTHRYTAKNRKDEVEFLTTCDEKI